MRAGGVQGRVALREPTPEQRVAAVMAAHGRLLLHVAHQWSLCHDDALDAYQRGLEIFFKRADTVEPATEVAWLKVVVKHEAMAIRRSRQDSVADAEPDLDSHIPAGQRSVDEQIESGERVDRSAEALRSLKPDEAKALLLKAEGLSYVEIGEQCGWSYTKVNRALTEGRKRFLKAYRAIEAGDECKRFAPVLLQLAQGEASSAELVEVRPHLRHCTACRATVRDLHMSALRRMRIFAPVALLAPVRWLQERIGVSAHPDGIQSAEELIRESGTINVPASAAPPEPHAIDLGGQLAIELPERASRLRLGRAKDEAIALLHRSNSSDVAAGIHIASSSGGGRLATVATLIGFCISGAGAGALCVATGVVNAPGWMLPRQAEPAKPRSKPVARNPSSPSKAKLAASVRTTEVVATPTPAPTPPRATPLRRVAATVPSQGPQPGHRPEVARVRPDRRALVAIRRRVLDRAVRRFHTETTRPTTRHRRRGVHAVRRSPE